MQVKDSLQRFWLIFLQAEMIRTVLPRNTSKLGMVMPRNEFILFHFQHGTILRNPLVTTTGTKTTTTTTRQRRTTTTTTHHNNRTTTQRANSGPNTTKRWRSGRKRTPSGNNTNNRVPHNNNSRVVTRATPHNKTDIKNFQRVLDILLFFFCEITVNVL